MDSPKDPKAVLASILRERLIKDPALAAKQRRLLDMLNPPVDALEMEHQQRMADAVAQKLWPRR